MSLLFGSKDEFAIEYTIVEIHKGTGVIAKVIFWIENLYIGCFEVEAFIHQFNAAFKAISEYPGDAEQDKLIKQILSIKDSNYIYNNFKTFTDRRYYSIFGVSFDDFSLITLNNAEKVIFLWKLGDHNYVVCKDELEKYPKGAHLKVVDKKVFRAVLEEYLESYPKGITP